MAAPRERMLRLLSLLQSGRRWPADELAAAMETHGRTLRRDIDHLRQMGYPVESTRGPGGHYRLRAGGALPPLMLEDDEAVVTVLGLRLAATGSTRDDAHAEAAERAVAKLRRILPAPLRRRADEILAAVEVGRTEQQRADPAVFQTLASVIRAQRRLAFDYTARQATSRREVEPARLLHVRGRWYLFAWDLGRGDWRSFRLDRLVDPRPLESTFRPRTPPAEDLAGYLQDRVRPAPTRRVVLTLHASAREAAARLYRVDGSLEPVDADTCRYEAHVDSYEWLATVLVLADLEFTVEEPQEFAAYLAEAAHRLLRGAGKEPR
ncbi:helix-turn-helix transcriptional regulator [Mumia quercus]|uniref:helix-turn-helix transcriptional regulator n=1 Tax=Mumia quercus TaxID=2976125 RepID=UPI0021CEDC21|nr:YafY family protein [Mumia quercus]